jgi:hypothetical protein
VIAPAKLGASVTDTIGVVPPVEEILPVPVTDVTVPLPVPQAPATVVNRPAVDACTQLPELSAESVTLENTGAAVIEIAGVRPPVEAMFPVPVTAVTGLVTRAALGTVADVRPTPEP